MNADLLNDPISSLLEMKGDSAAIIPDPINGYDRVVPTTDVLDDIVSTFCTAIVQAALPFAAIGTLACAAMQIKLTAAIHKIVCIARSFLKYTTTLSVSQSSH